MLCFTFDSDHMDEDRMTEFLDKVEIPGVATLFCTQKYACLGHSRHELGPHPRLDGGVDWQAELESARAMFPQARGWRSHACVFSNGLAEWLAANGYLYVSTNDQFGQKGIRPVRPSWGVWHLPIFYMDTMDFSSSCFWEEGMQEPFSDTIIETALCDDGLYVFDFHPIHLLLNTPNRDYYFAMRDPFKAGKELGELAHPGEGTRSFYERLCAAMRDRGQESVSLGSALEAHLACGDGAAPAGPTAPARPRSPKPS